MAVCNLKNLVAAYPKKLEAMEQEGLMIWYRSETKAYRPWMNQNWKAEEIGVLGPYVTENAATANALM